MPLSTPQLRLLLWFGRIAAIAAYAVLVTASLLPYHDWPAAHEGRRYHFMTAEFFAAIQNGAWYPRWLPDLAGGYGYPTFVFYQPGYFFVSSLWMRLLDSTATANYATVLTFAVLGGIGAFLLARELADEWAAWFCAALLLLTPYFYCNIFVRGDLSELAAMLFVPWLLFFAVRIVRGIEASRPVPLASAGLGAAMAAIVYCHAMTAMFAAGVLVLVAIGLIVQRLPLRPLLAAIVQSGLVAAALAIFYALPLVQMSKHVDFRAAVSGYFQTTDHAVYPLQYLQSQWGFGESKKGPDDGMSFQLGLPHFAIAAAGLIASWKNRLYRAVFASYLVLLLAATHCCWWLWNVPPLSYVQFPWRILAVTAGLQVLLASGIHAWLPNKPAVKLLVYLALLVVVVHWSRPQFIAQEQRYHGVDAWIATQRAGLLTESITYAGADEFRPRTAAGLADVPPRGTRPLVEVVGTRRIRPAAGSTNYRIAYEIDPGPPTDLVINQAYFPGWYVELGGKPVPREDLEGQLTADGRMQVHVASSEPQVLMAYYAGPPGGATRLALFAVLAGAFLAWAGYQWKTMPRPPVTDAAEELAAADPPVATPPTDKRPKGDRKSRKGKGRGHAA